GIRPGGGEGAGRQGTAPGWAEDWRRGEGAGGRTTAAAGRAARFAGSNPAITILRRVFASRLAHVAPAIRNSEGCSVSVIRPRRAACSVRQPAPPARLCPLAGDHQS